MKKRGIARTRSNREGRRVSLWTVSLVVGFQVLVWVLFSMAIPGPAGAKTFTVNSTLDETDTNPGDGVCVGASGYCTLRAAIQEANALVGPDVIKLKTGLYMLTIPGISEDLCTTGDLDITDDLAIIGTGAKNTFINGGKLDRVFHIIGSISVSFANLTIQNGLATEGGPSGESFGGGVFNNGGTLEIIASCISNNVASGPVDAYGGGIYSNGGSLTIKKSPISNIKSSISNNVARGGSDAWGGGIFANSTVVTIRGSTLSNNVASGGNAVGGGGIFNLGNTVTITGSTLSNNSALGNTAGYGGSIYNGNGATTIITGSTIFSNIASGDSWGSGGGIYCKGGILTVAGSTLSNNSALGSGLVQGGGIYNTSGTVKISRSTLSNNSASAFGGTAGEGGGIYHDLDTLTVRSASKIIRNFASDSGGGIYVFSGTATVSPDSVVNKNIPNDMYP